MRKKIIVALISTVLTLGLLVGCGGNGADENGNGGDDIIELSFMVGDGTSQEGFMAVSALAEEAIGVRLVMETRPGGLEGENLLRTRLATGDAADLLWFNSGALLETMNPTEHFIDITNEPFAQRLEQTFKSAVTVNGQVFGLPGAASMGGGVFFNRDMYERLNLEIPNTWEEFLANAQAIQDAGYTAIVGSYADAWTAQIPWLADNFNLLRDQPDFPEQFELGNAKWADTPAALRGFEKLDEIRPFLNSDFLATTFEEGVDIMANGEAGHFFMLTFALQNVYEMYGRDYVENIGFFGVPGDSGERGMTVWVADAFYGNANSENKDAILRFMEFFMTDEAIEAFIAVQSPVGPLPIIGFELPETAFSAVRIDMQRYFDAGLTAPALEFITSVKGPNAPLITQAVISGQMSPLEAAHQYDEDCAHQARQLGLDWD